MEGGGQGPLAKEGWLYSDIYASVPEFRVTPLLMGPACLCSQRRCERKKSDTK